MTFLTNRINKSSTEYDIDSSKTPLLSRSDLEKLLLTDGLFVDTLNVYLALPVFGFRIFYNKTGRIFEQHRPITTSKALATIVDPNMEYIENGKLDTINGVSSFIRVLNAADCIDFLMKEVVRTFCKSEIYFQYLLLTQLVLRGHEKLIVSRDELMEFLRHLEGTVGHSVYMCWLDVMRASNQTMNSAFDRYFMGYLRRIYFSKGSIKWIPSINIHSYRRIPLPDVSEILKAELVDRLFEYWRGRYVVHVSFNNITHGPSKSSSNETFITQRSNSSYGEGLKKISINNINKMIRVPLDWRQYKLPGKFKFTEKLSDFMNVDKKDILLRTISLEKRSGGFLWENIQYMNLSKGIKRCLSFLYFVQLWLEFAIPAILNKRKIETRMTDFIYFSCINITGDQWIGCPEVVRDAVCQILRERTGNLDSFKSAVDFSLQYLLKPFMISYKALIEDILHGIRVEGEREKRAALTEKAKTEDIFVSVSNEDAIFERVCMDTVTLNDVSRRHVLQLLNSEDWLSEIMCHRFPSDVEVKTDGTDSPRIEFIAS